MKQKISFNPRIYLEGLRQLRVTGLISVIIMFAITVFRITAELPISYYSGYEYTGSRTYTGVDWMPWLIISFVIITPLLTLQMFQFMNKRNASDFYHSLPHTRSTIYLSLLTAVLTWILLSILATIIPSLFSALVFSKYISFVYDTFFLYMAFCIASSVLVAGAIMIAKGLSGTILNSIILTGVVLFLPRLIMGLLIGAIELNPILDGTIGNSFTSSDINPVTGIVFSMFGIEYTSEAELLISVPAIVYGFILGLIYLSIGMFLFIIRKSETASQSATSRRMQAVFRILITTAICIPAVTNIFHSFTFYGDQDMYWYGMVIYYVVVVFVYFLYELLTTKKLRNLVKAIPGLGLVAVFNIAMYFGISACYNSAIDFRPAADEINSVKVLPEAYGENDYLTYYDYVLNEVNGVVITSPEVIEDVSVTLNQNLSDIEKSLNVFYDKLYNANSNLYDGMMVEIETNGGSVKRNIYMTEEAYTNVSAAISNSKDFQKAWMTPPDEKRFEFVNTYSDGYGNSYIGETDAIDLYEMYRKELKNADFQKFFDSYIENAMSDMRFEVCYLMDGKTYYVTVPVYEDVTPDTYARYMELYEAKQLEELKNAEEYLTLLENSGADFYGDVWVDVCPNEYSAYSTDGVIYETTSKLYFNQGFSFENSTDIIRELLAMRSGDLILASESAAVMNISFNVYDVTDDNIDSLGFYLALPADENVIEKLEELEEKYYSQLY